MTTIEVRKKIYVLFSIEDAFCCIFTSLDILLTPFWHIIYQYMYICLLLFVVVLLLYSFSFFVTFSRIQFIADIVLLKFRAAPNRRRTAYG